MTKSENKKVGIIGGGQLGMMMFNAAQKIDIEVVVLDPNPNCPASLAGAKQIIGNYQEEEGILELSKECDVVTIDLEHVNYKALEKVVEAGVEVYPQPEVIKIIQDKYIQKKFLKDNNIEVAPFGLIENLKNLNTGVVVKARRGGFDGRGNTIYQNASTIEKDKYNSEDYYYEELLDFKTEIAVVVAKNVDNVIKMYDVFETIHENSICVEVFSPASISIGLQEKAKELALKVVNAFDVVGVMAIEMFVLKDDSIVVNEVAPRVHNSGHLTLGACITSQFEQHIRSIVNLELGETSLILGAGSMLNIIGDCDGEAKVVGVEEALEYKNVDVQIYKKEVVRKDRKMGHITTWSKDVENAKLLSRKIKEIVKITC